jgi:hypothetical protein
VPTPDSRASPDGHDGRDSPDEHDGHDSPDEHDGHDSHDSHDSSNCLDTTDSRNGPDPTTSLRRRALDLLEEIKDILLASIRVIYVEEGEPIHDSHGNIAYNYTWQLIGKTSVIEFLQYRKNEGKEQFAPVTILRTINTRTSQGAYVAPLTLTLDRNHANISLDWWAWFRISFSITWESHR